MLSLIYSSVSTRPLGEDDLEALLEQSRESNEREDITGVLLFRNGYFLQVLEGPDAAVRAKLDRIKHDERHTQVRVILEELVEDRQFPEWTMGFPAAERDLEEVPGYRSTFEDLDQTPAADVPSASAVRELVRWFRPSGA
ncbi:BLUF domain-containing protein [Curtobacterium sp. L1-20]|uniref:BLUF domain-containing protein n=1 Tax=Curtobacterium sp. L1-20 TaxID=3138181 RepID=UPI003B52B642